MRVTLFLYLSLGWFAIGASLGGPAYGQPGPEIGATSDAGAASAGPNYSAPLSTSSLGAPPPATGDTTPLSEADAANLDGCQRIAQIDDQVILACDVLWRVNQRIEIQKEKMGEKAADLTPEQVAAVREQLMKMEVQSLVDRKLLYNEFRRNVPTENLARIDENLRQPFEEKELPNLMKQLHVSSKQEAEQELTRLGSSLADAQRAFNERVIAAEWIHSKVKINEEVSPDEMIEYYRAHGTEYDYPTQARWEELAVRKNKYRDAREAFAAIANLGNEVWQRGARTPVKGAAFAEVAIAKSDGFTAKSGGVHDWTTKGALQCKAIDEAIFTLQVGQMSPIIDGGPMFHIVRVLERKEAGRKPYIDVQGDIRDKLKEQRFQAGVEQYLAKLRGEARVWTAYTGNVSADVLLGRKADDTQRR